MLLVAIPVSPPVVVAFQETVPAGTEKNTEKGLLSIRVSVKVIAINQ